MSGDQADQKDLSKLPKQPLDHLARPFNYFLELHAASSGMLLLATLAALVLSNSPWRDGFLGIWEVDAGFRAGTFEFSRTWQEWINDALMTFFFFLVALELKRELVLGELKHPRLAALSIAAALGGMVVPAGLYLLLQTGGPAQAGWGLVMATDTAFVIACLALLGTRIPQSLRVFILSLAIVDDIGAILVVAVGYSDDLAWVMLGLSVLGFLLIRVMALLGVRTFPPFLIAGGIVWLAVDASGIHATITGVILGLMTPARRLVSDKRLYAILDKVVAHPARDAGSGDTRDRNTLQKAEVAARETLSPLERLEIALHPWVGFAIMPLFALANAGLSVDLDAIDGGITTAVFISFILGKPVGILVFSWLAVITGIALRPDELNWKLMAGGGMLAGIGFTMALFIAHLSLPIDQLNSAKVGILLASVGSAIGGIAVLLWATRGTGKDAATDNPGSR